MFLKRALLRRLLNLEVEAILTDPKLLCPSQMGQNLKEKKCIGEESWISQLERSGVTLVHLKMEWFNLLVSLCIL